MVINIVRLAFGGCFKPSFSNRPSKSKHKSEIFHRALPSPHTFDTSSDSFHTALSSPFMRPACAIRALKPSTLSKLPNPTYIAFTSKRTGGFKYRAAMQPSVLLRPMASCSVHAYAPLKRQRKETHLQLLDLPDDILMKIMDHVMDRSTEKTRTITTEESFRVSLPLAQTCHAFYDIWRRSMYDLELWPSGGLDDLGLRAICKRSGPYIHRLGLRKCKTISSNGFDPIPQYCTTLRSIDLSHTDVTDQFVVNLTRSVGRTLQVLALHGCNRLTSASIREIADRCPNLRFLDIGSIAAVDDAAVNYLVHKLGSTLRTMILSFCKTLSDTAMAVIGEKCLSLTSLTIRGLPLITDSGVQKLCVGVGEKLQILDVLDCHGLTAAGYLAAMQSYCPHVFKYLEESNYLDHLGERCLQDNIISTMPGLIYRITATDAIRKLPAIYFLLLDESTIRAFRISVQSKSLNLSDFGKVLISNFGNRPTQRTRSVLLARFGHDSAVDTESDEESCG